MTTSTWKALKAQSQKLKLTPIDDLDQCKARKKSLIHNSYPLSIDFSKQAIDENALSLLIKLAHERQLAEKIQAMFRGDIVNPSEKKPALHVALRIQNQAPILVENKNIVPLIWRTRGEMEAICYKVRAGLWLGFSGKPICDIINIGIGGSDLGPKFCFHALKKCINTELHFHFISDVDPSGFNDITEKLNPETTLIILSSKSFTTQETLYNAQKAFQWLGSPESIKHQVIAVTANTQKAKEYGIQHILPLWDWIGGRFSVCSAINLITAIAIGFPHFSQLLAGANSIDQHFLKTDFRNNLPVLLGLIGIWNNNFLDIHNLLILSYAKQLEYLLPYIQQVDMESNGKSIDMQGSPVNYSTAPIIWGGLGNQAQHSYYQLLSQGTHKIALDFITLKTLEDELIHNMFMIKKNILSKGFHNEDYMQGYIAGNNPLNHISLADDSPFSIGALIALYEHKIYVQSIIWNINPFDQPGVESIKQAALLC